MRWLKDLFSGEEEGEDDRVDSGMEVFRFGVDFFLLDFGKRFGSGMVEALEGKATGKRVLCGTERPRQVRQMKSKKFVIPKEME